MTDLAALQAIRRALIKKRPSLSGKAKRIASNIIEQTLQIHNEADLERLRPYMTVQHRLLERALAEP